MSWVVVIGWLGPPPSLPLSLSPSSLCSCREEENDVTLQPSNHGQGRGVVLRDAEEEEEEDRPCRSRGAPAPL